MQGRLRSPHADRPSFPGQPPLYRSRGVLPRGAGAGLQRDTGAEAAFGTPDQWCFFVYPADAGQSVIGHRTHVAWAAPSRAAVEAVHAAALARGAADIFTPRLRPDISETYFGAMFTDLDGHRVEVKTDGD